MAVLTLFNDATEITYSDLERDTKPEVSNGLFSNLLDEFFAQETSKTTKCGLEVAVRSLVKAGLLKATQTQDDAT